MQQHYAVAVSFLLAVGGVGCFAQPPGNKAVAEGAAPLATPVPAAADAGGTPAPTGPPTAGAGADRPLFSDCVIHAGLGSTKTRKLKRPGGVSVSEEPASKCAMNAECIHKHGTRTPGDGLVSITCEGRSCHCLLEPLADGSKPISFQVDIEAPCATPERARSLLLDRCMRGMKVRGKK